MLLCIPIKKMDRVVNSHPEVQHTMALYARRFAGYVNEVGPSDVMSLPSWMWDDDFGESEGALAATPRGSVSLPWRDDLPTHIMPNICVACVKMARRIAADGLDENRPHHGFCIIIGDTTTLESCGRSGFNPFVGHAVSVLGSDGHMDEETFDLLRRNAFNTDGAIVVDGSTGRIKASGWFVSDISMGGLIGGARSRSAKAIAQQAGSCYVVKCSEDSSGELTLYLGERQQGLHHDIIADSFMTVGEESCMTVGEESCTL